jgi:hypothetical protein
MIAVGIFLIFRPPPSFEESEYLVLCNFIAQIILHSLKVIMDFSENKIDIDEIQGTATEIKNLIDT